MIRVTNGTVLVLSGSVRLMKGLIDLSIRASNNNQNYLVAPTQGENMGPRPET